MLYFIGANLICRKLFVEIVNVRVARPSRTANMLEQIDCRNGNGVEPACEDIPPTDRSNQPKVAFLIAMESNTDDADENWQRDSKSVKTDSAVTSTTE